MTRSCCYGMSDLNPTASITWHQLSAVFTLDIYPGTELLEFRNLHGLWTSIQSVLQVQEKMTAEIANCLNSVLKPHGVGVVVEAAHQCMTTRGVHKTGVTMVTSCLLGSFRTQPETRQEFLSAINLKGAS